MAYREVIPGPLLTLIVRDEQFNLPRCLESVRGLFDEIVVVDTGTKDRTVEIARSFGARVFDFVWIDDFAAARNAALVHATGDYVFWLDADDLVEPAERVKLEELLGRLPRARPHGGSPQKGTGTGIHGRSQSPFAPAYVVRCACDPGPRGSGGDTVVDHIRLFPLLEGVRWTYKVHEQILPSLRRAGVPVQWTDITVRHTGYADREVRTRKLVRDTSLPAWTRESTVTSPGATWPRWPENAATTPKPSGCGERCSPNAPAIGRHSAS